MKAPLTLQPTVVTAELLALAAATAAAHRVPLVVVAPPAPVLPELLHEDALLALFGLNMSYLRESGCPVVLISERRTAVFRSDLMAFLAGRRADPNAVPVTGVEAGQ